MRLKVRKLKQAEDNKHVISFKSTLGDLITTLKVLWLACNSVS